MRQWPHWELLVPQERDTETDTKQVVNRIKRTELTSSNTGIVMLKPRDLETVVSQRQYFQNPVQIHEALDVIQLERMQEVTFVVRNRKKPDEPEER